MEADLPASIRSPLASSSSKYSARWTRLRVARAVIGVVVVLRVVVDSKPSGARRTPAAPSDLHVGRGLEVRRAAGAAAASGARGPRACCRSPCSRSARAACSRGRSSRRARATACRRRCAGRGASPSRTPQRDTLRIVYPPPPRTRSGTSYVFMCRARAVSRSRGSSSRRGRRRSSRRRSRDDGAGLERLHHLGDHRLEDRRVTLVVHPRLQREVGE